MMFDLKWSILVLISFIIVLLFTIIYTRLLVPPDYQQLSLSLPAINPSLWHQLTFSLDVGFKRPKDLLPYYIDLIKKHGSLIHIRLLTRSYFLLNNPDDLKIILSNSNYNTKSPEYDLLKPWLNDGILLSSGSKWQIRRKLLTQAFHFKTLEMYNPSINKHSRILVEKLLNASANKKEIDITNYVTLCSLDIICESIMGTNLNAQRGESKEYVHCIKNACKSVIDRVFKFWLWNDIPFRISPSGQLFYKSVKVLHEFTDNVIKKKQIIKNDLKKQNSKSQATNKKMENKSFLDLLLDVLEDYPNQMTDKDIREEVDTFLFEGHDTSSASMTISIILLGLYQDIQDRARDELYSIFGDSDRNATMEDLNAMRYLEAVIKESLRLFPSVPGFSRELKTPLKLKNLSLPSRSVIFMFPYIIHRNEDVFPNPEEFIPERFLDEKNKDKFLFSYIPFSAGPRNCIGQKYVMYLMKTVLSTILRKSKIETIGRREDIEIALEVILRVETNLKVKFYEI